MFEKISSKRLAGLILAGVITISGATSAFAADQSSIHQAAGRNKPARMDFSKMSAEMKAAIEKLVTAGTITQAQADTVLKIYTPAERKGAADRERKHPIAELVTAGTITQAQADEVAKVFTPGERKGMTDKARNNPMDDLMEAGTITQSQADAIDTAVKAAMESLKEN